MPTNETINNTVAETATEMVNNSGSKDMLVAGLGFLGGVAITIAVVKGVEFVSTKRQEKKKAKADKPKLVPAE